MPSKSTTSGPGEWRAARLLGRQRRPLGGAIDELFAGRPKIAAAGAGGIIAGAWLRDLAAAGNTSALVKFCPSHSEPMTLRSALSTRLPLAWCGKSNWPRPCR